MKKKNYIIGIVLGLVVPYIGIFVGLQVSTVLGNILAFPIIGLSYVTSIPFGMWHPLMWILSISLSIFAWIVIVILIDKLFSKKSS